MTSTSLLPDVGIELREGYAEVGDQSLHYVEAGDGPLVVLLHGFPEFWFGWPPLSARMMKVTYLITETIIVIDQNTSEITPYTSPGVGCTA
jgi:hypothetical protein